MKPEFRRAGWLLVEMVVALTMGAVALGSLATLLSAGVRWTRSLSDQAEALEVVRTIWVVIEDEIRAGRADRDWLVDGRGALLLRSFQGVAPTCDYDSTSGWKVAHRGRRSPDLIRDSILLLGLDGSWRSIALESSVLSEGCDLGPGESAYRWGWSDSGGSQPVLARTFETGSYHLADGAFRYQRGAGGRQPLTAERLSDLSGFRRVGDGLEVTVDLTGGPGSKSAGSFVWLTRQAAATK